MLAIKKKERTVIDCGVNIDYTLFEDVTFYKWLMKHGTDHRTEDMLAWLREVHGYDPDVNCITEHQHTALRYTHDYWWNTTRKKTYGKTF